MAAGACDNAGMKTRFNIPKLRNALALTGLTQEEIARKCNLSTGTISYVLNGQQPKSSTIQRIAAIVGLRLEDLLIPEPEHSDG